MKCFSRIPTRPSACAAASSLLAALLLSSCGSETEPNTAEPSSDAATTGSPSASPTTPSDGPVDFELVLLETRTAVGGSADRRVVSLDDAGAIEEFVGQFEVPGFRAFVRRAAVRAVVPSDRELLGSVVTIGCETPSEVLVTREHGQIVIRAPKPTGPPIECFAPMTTVALITVPG